MAFDIFNTGTGDHLNPKVALVTGGSRGIGLAIAQRLSLMGYRVVINYNSNEEEAYDAVGTLSLPGHVIQADISNVDGCEQLISQTVGFHGRLDVLVNNAGITRDGATARMSEVDWDDVLDTNLKGAAFCSSFALQAMSLQRFGRIVNIASIVGRTGQKHQANYAASKGGLIALTRALAREYGSPKRDITVNAIAPGFIKTKMTDVLPVEVKNHFINQTPLGRMGMPEDVAGVVAFLVSPDANFMTGAVIDLNGGLFMG